MALKGLTKASVRTFESANDPDKGTDKATKFKLRYLDSFVMAYLKDTLTSFEADPLDPTKVKSLFNPTAVALETVRYGLSGWENFVDEDGSSIEFKTVLRSIGGRKYPVLTDELLGAIPLALIEELSVEIRKSNSVTAAEVKNSD